MFCSKSPQGKGSVDSPCLLSRITNVSESRPSNKCLTNPRLQDRFDEGNDRLFEIGRGYSKMLL